MSPPSRRDVLGAGAGLAVAAAGVASVSHVGPDPPFAAGEPEPGSWPLSRYDPRNSGYNPHASVPRSDPEVAWQAASNAEVAAVVVADDAVFAGDENGVRALAVADGRVRWESPEPGHRLAFAGGVVYAVGEQERLAALNAATGEARWRETSRFDHAHHLLVGDDALYAGMHGVLEARDAATGDLRWHRDVGGSGRVATALAHGRAYVGGPGPTNAFEPRSDVDAILHSGPRRAWRAPGPTFGYPPAVDADAVYVGSEGFREPGQAVHRYDPDTGERRWHAPLGTHAHSPAVADGRLFATGVTAPFDEPRTARVVELDPATGDVLWRFDTRGWVTPPVVADGTVLVGSRDDDGGAVYALDADAGETLWTRRFDGGVRRLAAVGETVYVGAQSGTVYALRSA